MAASTKKIEEAKKYLLAGDKCLKTSLLKWNPDYDGAAAEYTKAATAFKVAKAYSEAKQAFVKAANAQKSHKAYFHAAKSLESAGMMCKELNQLEEAASLIEQAAYMHRENGTVDTAAITLERAGKMIELNCPERAVQLFQTACDVAETEDRHGQAAQMVGKAARILIRLNRLEEAAPYLQKEMSLYSETQHASSISKTLSGLVLLHLHLGDNVAANRAFSSGYSLPGVAQCDEMSPLQQLLSAYDEDDMERVSQLAWSSEFKYLDTAFSKLAKSLSEKAAANAARGGVPGEKPTVAEAGASGNQDDFEEGGLC